MHGYAYGNLGEIAELGGTSVLREQLDLSRASGSRLFGAEPQTLFLPGLDQACA